MRILCRIHEHDDPFFTFPVDHVVAQKHGGSTTADNLCFSCFRCNVHKGLNLTSVDPLTAATVRLFHPRRDVWEKHFHWEGPILAGDTPIGRATIDAWQSTTLMRCSCGNCCWPTGAGYQADRAGDLSRRYASHPTASKTLDHAAAEASARFRSRCSSIASTPATSDRALAPIAGSISGTAPPELVNVSRPLSSLNVSS